MCEHNPHSFLVFMGAAIARCVPPPWWAPGDRFAVGVATPVKGQWVVIEHQSSTLHVQWGLAPGPTPRGALVLDIDSATAVMRGEPLETTVVVGDAAFVRRIISSCLTEQSSLGIRLLQREEVVGVDAFSY